jgi:hypothetical protein
MHKIPDELVSKFQSERHLGDKSVPLWKQVYALEKSGTFQRLVQKTVDTSARGLAAEFVADANGTKVSHVWVSIANK